MNINKKEILKNISISIILGIILGFITEFALIFNMEATINVTQSLLFWAFVITIVSIFSKDYKYSIINSSFVMSFMSISYYLIRYFKSGFADFYSMRMWILVGITGSLYFATIIYVLKNKILNRRENVIPQICSIIFMTIFGIFAIPFSMLIYFVFRIGFFHNGFWNISIGVILGFIIGDLLGKGINKLLGKGKNKIESKIEVKEE